MLMLRVFGLIVGAIKTAVTMLRHFGGQVDGPESLGAPLTDAEVEKVLVGLAAAHPEFSDWRNSIVDLMKILNLDSSLSHRQELAAELGYTGARNGSAEMNVWLHKEVMRKVAEDYPRPKNA